MYSLPTVKFNICTSLSLFVKVDVYCVSCNIVLTCVVGYTLFVTYICWLFVCVNIHVSMFVYLFYKFQP